MSNNTGIQGSRKPKVYIPEKILKLVQHQCEIYGLKCHTLIGSMVVEDDGEGVQFQVDRLDTRPLVSPDISANLAPGDLLIPLEVTNNSAKDRSGSENDYSTALERLQVQCCSKSTVDVSNFVLLRAWGSFYSNSTTSVIHMDFDLVTMGTIFKAIPINPVPIALTALSKNLAGPMSLSNTQGVPKSGYLTMDHTRKLLLVLESDPKSTTLPIVGIWVCGVDFLQHPFVWASCLRYIHNTHLQDRVCVPPEDFLVVLYSNLHTRPEFFQCCTATGETKLIYELRSGHEVGNLTKALSNPSEDFFEIELNLPEYGEKKSIFDAAVDKFISSVISSDVESHCEESSGVSEDIQPRSAPTPYTEKIPVFKPMVPDVSVLWPDVPHQSHLPTSDSHQTPQHSHRSSFDFCSVSITNGYSKPASEHRPQFHNVSDVLPNRSLPVQARGQALQHPSYGHYPQITPQHSAPAYVSAMLPKKNMLYSSASDVYHSTPFQGYSQVPQSMPDPSRPLYSNEASRNAHQQMRPFQQAMPVVVSHSKQSVLPNRYGSTHDCTFNQSNQLAFHTINVTAHHNDHPLLSSHSGRNCQINASCEPTNKNGLISSSIDSSRNPQGDVSVQSLRSQIIKKDIVMAQSSPQIRYPCGRNHSQLQRAASIPYHVPLPNEGSPMASRPMCQTHGPYSAQSHAVTPCSLGQQATARIPQCQSQPDVGHLTTNLRHCQAPMTLLNTVVEENLSSATSSSEESCQCHPEPNLKMSIREENVSSTNGSNNTQNSTKSSDDDSGLSITPERQVSSPHPTSNPSLPTGPFPDESVNKPMMSSIPNAAIDNVNWENVPPEIRALIIHQNEQLNHLQRQIQFLLKKESQPTTLEVNPSICNSPSQKAPSSNQQKNLCSVTVDATSAKNQNEDCNSRSVQTSLMKSPPAETNIPHPSNDNSLTNTLEIDSEHQFTDNPGYPENKPLSQQSDSVPFDEPSESDEQMLKLTQSALMDDFTHSQSDPRLDFEQSSSERNYFMDGQNDSFSTMAEDASDPRQYYDQLMNNIQLFLLNGENESDIPSHEADKTPVMSDDTMPYSDLPHNDNSTITPNINYMSMMFGLGSDSGQSMEINAMAMKYLKDEQLTQIARLRQKGGANASSSTNILQKVIGDMKMSTPEVSHMGISPNDLTMGTRNYMEKHGLLGDNSSEANDMSSLDYTMKLKTDFSMACLNHGYSDYGNIYPQDQLPKASSITPIRKEVMQRKNQQASVKSLLRSSPKSKETSAGLNGVKPGVGKDLGASPVLLAPKRYDMKEVFPKRQSSRPLIEQKKVDGKGGRFMRRTPDVETKAVKNSEEQQEDNILDIAKLKQLPKLL